MKPPVESDPPVRPAYFPPSRGRTLVLGAQYLRSSGSMTLAGGEQARSIGALASTGNSTTDLVPLALAFVAFGTLLARFGRNRKSAVQA